MGRLQALWSSESAELTRLAIDHARRVTIGRVLRSPMVRWRHGPPHADQLLILPQDIRAADPSFAREVAEGQFGLAGSVAAIGAQSPFRVPPVSIAWARELHGFGWLKHMRAAHSDDADAKARALTLDWIAVHRHQSADVAFEPAVVARRVMSWIANAPVLLDGLDPRTFATVTGNLGSQIVYLAASWREAPAGHGRLLCTIALTLAGLCISGHDRRLKHSVRLLTRELQRQVRADGGHVSRNPAVVVDLLLDLLPLRHCFAARKIEPPSALDDAISAMASFIHSLRLGDGGLARFNGVGPARQDEVAIVLTYIDKPEILPALLEQSRYVRLQRGDTVIVMDVGRPPPLAHSGTAQAGCLSIEVTAGALPLLRNGGMPGAAEPETWRPAARATSSHNTLCLAERSSAILVRDPMHEQRNGAAPIRHPSRVSATLSETDGDIGLTASHDGYERTFGVIHTRTIWLSGDGQSITGVDQLASRQGILRLKRDVPFAVHFHLPPAASCRIVSASEIEIAYHDQTPRQDQTWRFVAKGATVSIEESIHFADASGPARSLQVVLRGATAGETDVEWSLSASTPAEPVPGGRIEYNAAGGIGASSMRPFPPLADKAGD